MPSLQLGIEFTKKREMLKVFVFKHLSSFCGAASLSVVFAKTFKLENSREQDHPLHGVLARSQLEN